MEFQIKGSHFPFQVEFEK